MAPVRIRHIAICTAILILFYLNLPYTSTPSVINPSSGPVNGNTETLARYMNDRRRIPHIEAAKSSFSWKDVKFQYPPPLEPKLPPPASQRPPIQFDFSKRQDGKKEINVQDERRKEVLRVFLKSWNSYKQKAWMKDALKPLSGGYVDQFSGWAATLVDALDTLWIMGLKDEFYEAVAAVATIDFGKSTSGSVNMFETCIRYLGGLIAAYDLSGVEALKVKAVEVGDLLYAGFNTENGMPVDFIEWKRAMEGGGLYVEEGVVSASPGTITLEFARLSQITGDGKYYSAVSQVMETFYQHQNATKLPGMWPMMVSMKRKDVVSGHQFTIGGNADSLYEYLPKAHHLLGSTSPSSSKYEIMSRTFMDTAMTNLFFRPMIPGNEDILISGNVDVLDNTPTLDPESEHLSCFIGGLFALGGRLFQNETYVDTGAKLAQGCMYAYKSMPTGIMPERYNMVICPDQKNCKWDEALFKQEAEKRPQYDSHLPLGFTTAKDPRYILRPEAIESVFVLWRITGDPSYREAAWRMFWAVAHATETELANAAIEDVTVEGGGGKTDYMESFWLAETLKYFYLCFADTGLVSLDEFVLNTEAHPFRVTRRRKEM
ncbi:glycoside hydrolase family 47 protein [Amniculicola lignicola CBS 123094]|uniref:alpha-1,2-Mannosidase n=1 Tax=Amniculicola lignicola CBS 123094 TaxID=1392246 RepID=A0A6A5WCG1_9PLEO|nr:glycoside hydrolase family 47 protein [Amniculicola lignicola CBS 123094]